MVSRSKRTDQISDIKGKKEELIMNTEETVNCWNCGGEGYTLDDDYMNQQMVEIDCPICDRTGKVTRKLYLKHEEDVRASNRWGKISVGFLLIALGAVPTLLAYAFYNDAPHAWVVWGFCGGIGVFSIISGILILTGVIDV